MTQRAACDLEEVRERLVGERWRPAGNLLWGRPFSGLGQHGRISGVREEGVKEGGVPDLARMSLSLR